MVQFEEAGNFMDSAPRYHGTGSNLLKKFDIPLSHLDFEYVNTCKSADELEKIVQILESGEEGYYPQLLAKTEEKLMEIKPNSRYLKKVEKVLKKEDLKDKYEEISDDLTKWLDDINKKNDELESVRNTNNKSFPEIRQTKQIKLEDNKKKESNRIKSTDYKAWDKYDADTELLKMDLEEKKMKAEAEKSQNEKKKGEKKNKVKFNPFLTKAETLYEAQRENEKANEFFKAKEIENSIEHYTTSISYHRNPVTLKNRASAYVSIKKYKEAINDYNEALKFNENDFECLFRLAQCYNEQKNYHQANVYIENAIFINPNNAKAQKLAENIRKFVTKETNSKTRMKISNVEGEEKNVIEDDEKVKRKNGTKPILKKESKSEKVIVPIPGSSRMSGPYFKIVDRKKSPEIKKTVGFNLNVEEKVIVENRDLNEEKKNLNVKDLNDKKKDTDCGKEFKQGDKKEGNEEKKDEGKKNDVKNNEKKSDEKKNDEKKDEGKKGRLQIASKYINKSATEKNNNLNNKINSGGEKIIEKNNNDENKDKNNELVKKKIIEIEENLVLNEKGKTVSEMASEKVEKIDVKEFNQVVRGKMIELNEENHEIIKKEDKKQNNNINEENNQENIKIYNELNQITEDLKGGGEPCNENNQQILQEEIHMPYSFIQAWLSARKEENYEGFAAIIRNLDPERLTEVIGNKLDATMLNEILNCLYRHFTVVHEVEKVYNLLVNLSVLSRFNIITMFLSKNDKILLQNLFNFLRQHGKNIPKNVLGRYNLC
ncbi:RNA polymerase II-associated protein 3 [Onthophagus taurus]|uniref:RNA polymerase II-associated protein 3 n=1 Tax=Onthophagus taurus TaxID=166361 RepID=UPI0039BDE0CD